MANPKLTREQGKQANQLLESIRSEMSRLTQGDLHFLFALRRKVYTRLVYDERGTPNERRALKKKKRQEQDNFCPLCNTILPESHCVLDRFVAVDGYTAENTRLIHQACDIRVQQERKFA